MKIAQQKQIKAFLAERFGQEKGSALSARQEKELENLIKNAGSISESRQKTLTQRIFPCIALYRTLQQSGLSQEDAYAAMRTYMQEKVAAKQHASTARMERVPGFYTLYSMIFRRVMRTSDRWVSTQTCGRDSFDVTITECLWHTACTENGCAACSAMWTMEPTAG